MLPYRVRNFCECNCLWRKPSERVLYKLQVEQNVRGKSCRVNGESTVACKDIIFEEDSTLCASKDADAFPWQILQ